MEALSESYGYYAGTVESVAFQPGGAKLSIKLVDTEPAFDLSFGTYDPAHDVISFAGIAMHSAPELVAVLLTANYGKVVVTAHPPGGNHAVRKAEFVVVR